MKRIALALVALSALISGCGREAGATPPEPIVLRTYVVPAGKAEEARSVVNNALYRKDNPVGQASLTPNGLLVVSGTEGVQQGVRELIDALGKAPSQPASPPPIMIDYWLVVGRPAQKVTSQPPELKELAGALAAVQAADGPQTFQRLQRATLLSRTNERAELESPLGTYIAQHLAWNGERILADVEIKPPFNRARVDTRMDVAPGQIAVLAQTGAIDAKGAADGQLYYIVRADVVKQGP